VKYTGGKRTNLTLKKTYHARCALATIQFNTGKCFSYLYMFLTRQDAGSLITKLEDRRIKHNDQRQDRKRDNNKNHSKKFVSPLW
jgi:hypothetical protein